MKKQLHLFIYLFSCALALIVCSQSVKAQSYHLMSNNLISPDTACTDNQFITYDNSGNGYFAESAHHTDVNGDYYAIKISKLDLSGNLTAHTYYQYSTSGLNDKVVSMKIIGGYLYVLVNGTYDASPFDTDAVLLKYSLTLSLKWTQVYNGSGNPSDVPVALSDGPSSTILVLVASAGNMITLEYNSAGTLLYSANYDTGFSYNDNPIALRYNNNSIYVAGTSYTLTGLKTVLIKYDNSLNQQWASINQVSTAFKDDGVNDMTIDTSGNIYTAGGYNYPASHPVDIKYDQNTGAVLLLRKFAGVSGSIFRIFTDNNANPIIYVQGANDFILQNKTTGASTVTHALYPSVNTHFDVVDVEKGSDNNLYVFGNYDTTRTFMGGPITDKGYMLTKINTRGIKKWSVQNIVDQYYRSDLTVTAAHIAIKGSSVVYYASNEQDNTLQIQSWNYTRENAISANTGLRLGDDIDNSTAEITLYPNPAGNSVNVAVPSAIDQEATLTIHDITGKQLNEQKLNLYEGAENRFSVETALLNDGLYFVTIQTSESITTSKLVVKH